MARNTIDLKNDGKWRIVAGPITAAVPDIDHRTSINVLARHRLRTTRFRLRVVGLHYRRISRRYPRMAIRRASRCDSGKPSRSLYGPLLRRGELPPQLPRYQLIAQTIPSCGQLWRSPRVSDGRKILARPLWRRKIPTTFRATRVPVGPSTRDRSQLLFTKRR